MPSWFFDLYVCVRQDRGKGHLVAKKHTHTKNAKRVCTCPKNKKRKSHRTTAGRNEIKDKQCTASGSRIARAVRIVRIARIAGIDGSCHSKFQLNFPVILICFSAFCVAKKKGNRKDNNKDNNNKSSII